MAHQLKRTRVGAQEGSAYHSVQLVILASGVWGWVHCIAKMINLSSTDCSITSYDTCSLAPSKTFLFVCLQPHPKVNCNPIKWTGFQYCRLSQQILKMDEKVTWSICVFIVQGFSRNGDANLATSRTQKTSVDCLERRWTVCRYHGTRCVRRDTIPA
jgi:hypothetical protein